jgi:predicted nucleic acid-binding protein
MHWVAPSEKDSTNATLEQKLWDAADQFRAAGRPISQFDCQIAAIARAQGASVATRNTGGLEGCGVELIYPWAEKRAK